MGSVIYLCTAARLGFKILFLTILAIGENKHMFIVQLCEAERKIQEVLEWLTVLVMKNNVWVSFSAAYVAKKDALLSSEEVWTHGKIAQHSQCNHSP